jgi:hypothetical protein
MTYIRMLLQYGCLLQALGFNVMTQHEQSSDRLKTKYIGFTIIL